MIIVCDTTISERAILLRDEIFRYGYPCAVTSFDRISSLYPYKIALSFADVSDEAAHALGGNIPLIAVGEGFVNCLVYSKAEDTRAAIRALRSCVYELFDITAEKKSAFGFCLTPALFFSNDFFTLSGNVIEPTKSEYMIFKYLMAFHETNLCFTAELIAKYCFSFSRMESGVASVPVHIANLNKKITAVYKERVIRSHRGRGYYAMHV